MSASETTSISDLPNKMSASTSNVNDKLENEINNATIYNDNIRLHTSEIPQRDIPSQTTNITQDRGTTVNFVPESSNDIFYIPQDQSNAPPKSILFGLDQFISFEDLRMPIVVALLFVIFETTSVKFKLKEVFRFIADENNNLTNAGVLFTGLLFGTSYLVLDKTINTS